RQRDRTGVVLRDDVGHWRRFDWRIEMCQDELFWCGNLGKLSAPLWSEMRCDRQLFRERALGKQQIAPLRPFAEQCVGPRLPRVNGARCAGFYGICNAFHGMWNVERRQSQ